MSHTRKDDKDTDQPRPPNPDPLYYHFHVDPNLKKAAPTRRQSTSQLPSGTSKAGIFKQPSLTESLPAPVAPTPKR